MAKIHVILQDNSNGTFSWSVRGNDISAAGDNVAKSYEDAEGQVKDLLGSLVKGEKFCIHTDTVGIRRIVKPQSHEE